MVALLNSFAAPMPYAGSSSGSVDVSTFPSLVPAPPILISAGVDPGPSGCHPSTSNHPIGPYQSPVSRNSLRDDGTSEEPLESNSSEYERATHGDVGADDDDSDDDVDVNSQRREGIIPLHSERVMAFMNDVGNEDDTYLVDRADKLHVDMWNESENQIRLGMRFDSKAQLRNAMVLWSVSRSREFKVVESRSNTWAARCKTQDDCGGSRHEQDSDNAPCHWCVRAVLKKTHKMWQITRWVNGHNCLGSINSNDNRNLTSSHIATHILHSIEADPGYAVKFIQAGIKDQFGVDVSYKRAWLGRRKAIETVYGNWDSNFAALPKFIAALEHSNPETVVKWVHHPNSTARVKIFRYLFWAFGPAIDAFHSCRPVVSVDGTHLRGSYKGKLLVAVCKDANNCILPVAYAIVDEETVESWSWFMEQFRLYIAQDRTLCIISDRHRGIIHAMESLEDWKEPLAYHRFCLRHVRSNFMARFRNLALKKCCWALGSATEKRKFIRARREMVAMNPEAWQYLNTIDRSKWCLAYDGNHRWGCLTTNISESFNNVLKGARCLPITALIQMSFHRTVQLVNRNSERAQHCTTLLPPKPWNDFRLWEQAGQGHRVEAFDYVSGVYKVVTARRGNGKGGNVHTIHYPQRRCTCGKWQMYRFPCSHAIAVCRRRGDAPLSIVHPAYTTKTYKSQYSGHFNPLPHIEYWPDPGFEIQPDYTRFVAPRPGRRREARIRTEMDQRHPDEPRRCRVCHQPGHNRRNCPTSQPAFHHETFT